MQVLKTYKYKLKLTNEQSARVDSWIGVCRYVYNLALETKIEAYKKGVSLSKYDLAKQITQLKHIDWIKDVPSQSLADTTQRLDCAYKKFFAGGGFPKWAKKGRYSSLAFRQDIKQCEDGFTLPKIGLVKTFKDRMPSGKIKTAIIKKENKGYFICVTFESNSENLYPTSDSQAVGLDMGISYFLVDSNGEFVENPRYTKKYEAKVRLKNRELSRKKKGSTNWKRVKSELSNLHTKIKNCRNNFGHKVSTKYIKENSLIVCEDLNVKNMVKNGNLSKSISDAGWSSFFDKLRYKAMWYEKELVQIDPKFTSQKCSCCGFIAKENRLSQSAFLCTSCGHEQNADHNASLNILGSGRAFIRQREALACA